MNAVPSHNSQSEQPAHRAGEQESKPIARGLENRNGFDLFFGPHECATLHAPKFSFRENSHRGLRDLALNARSASEEELFWQQLRTPPKDPAAIQERQEVLSQLQQNATDKTGSAMSALYKYARAISQLYADDDHNHLGYSEQDSNRLITPFEKLLQAGVTAQNFTEKLQESAKKQRYSDPTSYDRALTALNALSTSKNIPELVRTIQSGNNSHLQAMCITLRDVIGEIPLLSSTDLLNLSAEEGKSKLIETRKKLKPAVDSVTRFGAILIAADLCKRDKYCQASFNQDKPESYTNAWNLLKERDGRKSTFGREEDVPPQVLGDSPPNKQWLLLRAGNESGKSFFMRRDLTLRLFAQAWGFAPAAQCNLHPRDSFVWLARPGTDPQKKLSSFGLDNQQIVEALPACRGRYRLYWDEPASTTGAMDQYCLTWGWSDYHLEREGEVIMATHSDELATDQLADHRCAVYHFDQKVTENGEIKYLYTLTPGADDSRAIEVARTNRFCPEILEMADQYLNGARPELPVTFQTRPLTKHSDRERENLKGLTKDFRNLVSACDYLVPDATNKNRLIWHHSGRDFDMPITVQRRSNRQDTISSLYTPFGSGGVLGAHVLIGSLLKGMAIHQEGWEYLEDLLAYGLTNDSAELTERAITFETLMESEFSKNAQIAITECWNSAYGWASLINGEIPKDDFVRQFVVQSADSCVSELTLGFDSRHGRHQDNSNFLARAVRFGFKISGKDFESSDCAKHLRVLEQVILLYKSYDEQLRKPISTIAGEDRADSIARLERQIRERDLLINQAYALVNLPMPTNLRSGVTQPLARAFKNISEAASLELTQIGLLDIEWTKERPALDELAALAALIKIGDYGLTLSPHTAISAMRVLALESDPFAQLSKALKASDSVHLHQLGNYFLDLGAKFIGSNSKAADFRKLIAPSANPWRERNLDGLSSVNAYAIVGELKRLRGLILLAQAMKRDGFCRVNFNSGDTLEIVEAWNAFATKNTQVANSSNFPAGLITSINTGANMSGKSHDIDKTILTLIFAQSTGFAPAKSMTSPVFDKIISLGRVNEALEYNFSGFGNERTTLEKALKLVNAGESIFMSFDEPYSTTSFKYQGALTFGTVHWAAKRGVRLQIASHAHDVVDHLTDSYPGRVDSWHFLTHVDSSGKMVFDHLKRPGHGASDGIAVAEALGAPGEVIARAKIARKRWQERHGSA